MAQISDLQKGLVLHLTMNAEDVDNGQVRDRSGYDNHGTIYQNADTGVSGANGESISLIGSNGGYVQTPAQDTFSAYTVSFWFFAQDKDTGGFLISTWDNNEINFRNNGNLQFWQGDNSGNRTYLNHSINENQWYHAAATWNGSQVELFVDGNSEGTNSISTIENGGSNDGFQIGQHAYGAERGLKAKVSDVRLYNRALSQPEIKRLANQRTSAVTSVGGTDVSDVDASGGNEYTRTVLDVNYKIHEFTSDGTFSVNEGGTVDVLVVGGGGGGGANDAGGGGGGGVIYETVSVNSNNYSITVGSGGSGNQNQNGDGQPGEDSIAFGLTAIGGGKGVRQQRVGGDGGSGGGGGHPTSSGGQALQPTSTDGGFGKDGGSGELLSDPYPGGGGGGAGSIGQSPSTSSERGHGGDGLYFGDAFSDQFGENGYFAGGGGGGSHQDPPSNGGIGGGGNGGTGDSGISTAVQNGQSNTGGGGGGSGEGGVQNGGNGGSGIVLIRYKK